MYPRLVRSNFPKGETKQWELSKLPRWFHSAGNTENIALTPSYTKENWMFVDWASFVLVTADEFPQKDSFALQNADLTKRNRVRLNLRFKEIWKNLAVVFCGTEIEPRVWQVKVLAGFSPVCQGLRPCSLNDSPPLFTMLQPDSHLCLPLTGQALFCFKVFLLAVSYSRNALCSLPTHSPF